MNSGVSIGSCIHDEQKIITHYEYEGKTHTKTLCQNCINTMRDFKTVKLIEALQN